MTSKKRTGRWTQWILNMNPSKAFWVFGLLLPMYMIWLRNVGLYTIDKNGRNKKVFNVLSAFLVLTVFLIILLSYVFQFSGHRIPDWTNPVIPLTVISIWFICNGITGKNMVDYENRNNEYFSGVTRTKEYIFRFFHLFYYPFSIYWLQKDVNKYLDSK